MVLLALAPTSSGAFAAAVKAHSKEAHEALRHGLII